MVGPRQQGTSGLQVQPGRQAAAHARQGEQARQRSRRIQCAVRGRDRPNGDIFVADGHGGDTNARIVKFDKDGKFIKTWEKKGAAPGDLDIPHAIAIDSRGRLFVGDRQNNRIQIFDQDGNYIDQWHQFSRPSGMYIDKNDTIYVADFESELVSKNHDGWKRGIRIGRVSDGAVTAFIPDPVEKTTGTSAAEGVAADATGNIYGAEVGPRRMMKYVKN